MILYPNVLFVPSTFIPYLRCWNAPVIILAEHSECLLVAGLHVAVLGPALHDRAKGLATIHTGCPKKGEITKII